MFVIGSLECLGSNLVLLWYMCGDAGDNLRYLWVLMVIFYLRGTLGHMGFLCFVQVGVSLRVSWTTLGYFHMPWMYLLGSFLGVTFKGHLKVTTAYYLREN